MKKIIYILLLASFFLLIDKKVEAVSFNSEAYEDIAISKDNGTRITFTYANRFYQQGTNLIAYCIEPFELLSNDGTYTEYSSYSSNIKLTKAQKERIDKLAYYGYGYTGHKDKKWVSITQMLIWRTSNPNHKFNWLDNLSNRNVITPYEKEIKELETLLKNHGIKPKFDNNLVIKDRLELEDQNNVLSDYKIKSTKLVDAKIEDGKLIIEAKDLKGEGEVVLEKGGNLGYVSKYYVNSSSQNVMTRGDYEPVEMKLAVTVIKGSLTIKKIDKDLSINKSQGEAVLNDAVFELLNENKEPIQEITLDSEGTAKIDNLDLGKYYLIEKAPGLGYVRDTEEHEINITEDNLDVDLTLENKVAQTKIIIKKLYGSKNDMKNGKMKPESNVTFEIYNSNNELLHEITTDIYGTAEVILPYGFYTLKQKNTTKNYSIVEDQAIKVGTEDGVTYTITLNDIEIEVPNAGVEESLTEMVGRECRELLMQQ